MVLLVLMMMLLFPVRPTQIVLDSVTFHFRHDFKDLRLRSRLLHGMAQTLGQLASDKDVAVLFVPVLVAAF